MRQKPGYLHMAVNVLCVVILISLCWTAAYYLTGFVYNKTGWIPHELIAFLINAISGFFIFGLSISLIGPFVKKREQHFFSELIVALRRISRGDFRVNLDTRLGPDNGKQGRKHPYAQLVESINEMAANLKVMEELRQQFISNVSHEIGSPLTSISGFAKALKNENLNQEQRQQYLTIIETECHRLSKLSDHLMKLAMLDSERHPFNPSSYRLDKQLVSLILACEPQWEAKKIEMNVEVEEVTIVADEDLMSQVWLNLFYNAIKFTPSGGKIGIMLAQNDKQAIIRVADTGVGISEKDQLRIFERFFKADISRERSAGGSGLGLSIASKIIELHQGSISVASKLGEGTEFTVQMPLNRK